MTDSSSQGQEPGISIQMASNRPAEAEFYKWLLQQKEDFKEAIIRFLSKCEKKKYKRSTEVKSMLSSTGYIKRTTTQEEYLPINDTVEPLMDLNSAQEIADLLAMELDPVHSTTWTDPMVRTNQISALFGLAAGQMLDNPRYKFKGNETDASAFTLMVCKAMQSVTDRSKGGLFMKEIAESTINYQNKTLSGPEMSPGGYRMPQKPSYVDRLFAPRKPGN